METVDLRSSIEHNGKLFIFIGLFGLPLAALSLVSGLHWSIGGILLVVVVAGAFLLARLFGRGRLDWSRRVSRPRAITGAAASLIIVAVLIQAVPYGRGLSNPPVVAEPLWDSEITRELAVKACFDCHSNEVTSPWYADIAPVSWAVQRHVDAGRRDLNFSEWNRRQKEAHESAETVEEGSMPPWYYNLTHSRLTDSEKQNLIRGLEATLGTEPEDERDDEEEEED